VLSIQVSEIKKSPYCDALTGLHNGALFYNCLEQALSFANRNKKTLAVLFISVDRLKLINDTLGESVGNQLLRAITKRLKSCLRRSDIVGRPGRNEFMVLLPEIRNAEDAARIARKFFASMEPPFVLKKTDIFITLSIGISVFPEDGNNAKAILKTSYTAMQRAKELGKNSYQFYSPSITKKDFERMVMENSLQSALMRKEFIMHYQPQIDLKTGRIIGAEALIRWKRPGVGLVYPKEFLPLMEETGLIVPLSEWVLKTACEQNKAWQNAGLQPIRIAVNVSARHFYEEDLTHLVSRVLEETGLAPRYLELELTENVFLQKLDRTVRALKVLRKMGVNISIDDFGTGYSSLVYLKHFPMNKLKIVEPFISSVSFSTAEEVIARAIIALAHTLNMKVVAEGVENESQLKLIRSLKCDELQGNIVSRPLPASRMARLLAKELLLKRQADN
jgi:diguanylate cyclase (GGDEF)-like protein